MRKPFDPGIAQALMLGMLLLGTTACRQDSSANAPVKSVAPSPSPVAKKTPATPATARPDNAASSESASSDSYKLALDKADSASNISQSAQSPDDWNLVIARWQQAVQLMRSVTASSPYHKLATAKIGEYEKNLAEAKKKAKQISSNEGGVNLNPLLDSPQNSSGRPEIISSDFPSGQSGRVFQARIKRREGGTPVINVTFNGNRTFEMIVDTGASGTVITAQMAASLGVQIVGKSKVDTASERGVEVPLAYIKSMAVGGAVVKEVVVAVGNSALNIGLLGHDFFGDYDVTVKRDVVEFRQRS